MGQAIIRVMNAELPMILTLILLVANLVNTKGCKNPEK